METKTTKGGGEVLHMKKTEVRRMLDAEAHRRFNISGDAFLRLRREGALSASQATSDLEIIASLVEPRPLVRR